MVCKFPRSAAEWHAGPRLTTHLNQPRLEADEICVDTRQNANMTLSRLVPCTALWKALLRAIVLLHPQAAGARRIPHINLLRYKFTSVHGEHTFVEVIPILGVFIWLWGIPPGLDQ
jgi:hypothetical protein